jgi:hypothetical protein
MKAVVVDGHTLGVMIGPDLQILRASVLRGSPHPSCGTITLPTDASRVRPATRQDFVDFEVFWHPDYEVEAA